MTAHTIPRKNTIRREDGMTGYTKPKNPYRHIHCSNNGYQVKKIIDGETIYAGTFKNLEEAQKERDYLESIDWDYNNIT